MQSIPAEIDEMMRYLAHIFAVSIGSPVDGEEDLYHDLIVYYLENYKSTVEKNQWYVRFKNFLINKYNRSECLKRIEKRLAKEAKYEAPQTNTKYVE